MGVRVMRVSSLGTALLVFLSICILANQATGKATEVNHLNLLTFIGSKQHPLHRGSSNLHTVSKRRVPNGPDPIHNRRARNFRESPTRA